MRGTCAAMLGLASSAMLAGASAGPARADGVAVQPPSGQALELVELLVEPQPGGGATWLVLRVLAPAIGTGQVDAELAQGDMDWACAVWGLAAAGEQAEPPAQVVVQMMDRIVPRGEMDMDATQYFAGYSIETGSCIWEVF